MCRIRRRNRWCEWEWDVGGVCVNGYNNLLYRRSVKVGMVMQRNSIKNNCLIIIF